MGVAITNEIIEKAAKYLNKFFVFYALVFKKHTY